MDGSTDKAEEIFKKRQRAEAFLLRDANFVKTSNHPSWQGKIRCRYCKSTGYPGDVQSNPYWWGKNHGYNCKWRELWMLKRQNYQNNITLTYGTTSNTGSLMQWVNSNGTVLASIGNRI